MNCLVCLKETQEDKPYCSQHIFELPYVQKLLREQSAIELELELSKQRKTSAHVTRSSEVVSDILIYCIVPRHIASIRSHMGFTPNQLKIYLNALKRFDLVTLCDDVVIRRNYVD